jgi:4-hydroxy-tetrahydrodipicolinate synthase
MPARQKAIVNPQSYLPLGEAEILKHYEAIARAVRIPLHVYNNPVSTGIGMSVALLRRIVDATGARSIKEAGSSVHRFLELYREFGDEVALHVGFHFLALGGFKFGARGWDVGLVPGIAPLCERLFRTAVLKAGLAFVASAVSRARAAIQFLPPPGCIAFAQGAGRDRGARSRRHARADSAAWRCDLKELRSHLQRAAQTEVFERAA